jgi:small subunit ribosomal protein S2
MQNVTVKELIDAGVHFGCPVSRWNPKMRPFIWGRRNLIHIMDLRETMRGLIRAQNFLMHVAADGHQILWVGTKRQVKGVIRSAGERTGMPIVTERWIGGTLTNFSVIRSRLRRLEELEQLDENGGMTELPKKMQSTLRRERKKIERNLSGIREMTTIPGAVVIVDPAREHNAVKEARRLGVPLVGILDTDCDPSLVDIVIPGNDDALRSVRLLVEMLVKSVEEGAATHRDRLAVTGAAERTEDQPVSDEPRPTRQRTLPRPMRNIKELGSMEESGLDDGEPERVPGASRVAAGEGPKE